MLFCDICEDDTVKYYHAKLLLYYPWFDEDELISGFYCYEKSYIVKQEKIVGNAKQIQ